MSPKILFRRDSLWKVFFGLNHSFTCCWETRELHTFRVSFLLPLECRKNSRFLYIYFDHTCLSAHACWLSARWLDPAAAACLRAHYSWACAVWIFQEKWPLSSTLDWSGWYPFSSSWNKHLIVRILYFSLSNEDVCCEDTLFRTRW